MQQPIIDTHVHIWDLSRAEYPWLKNDESILNRNYTLEDLDNERRSTNVKEGVLVQAAGNLQDTALILEAAKQNDWIKGIVGWLPLINTSKTQQLLEEKYSKEKYFKGVRHQIHDEKDPKWLLQPAVLESLRSVSSHHIPYDVVGILPEHIETVISVTEQIPGLSMVLDHLSQPPIAKREKFGRWGELIKEVAQFPNVYAKISGLGTASGDFSNWTKKILNPMLHLCLNILVLTDAFSEVIGR